MYVFGESFFQERDSIDLDATLKARKMIYKTKPKIVNLCPYCRAVLAGLFMLPLVWVSRKVPRKQKEPKPFDYKKSQRNLKIMKISAVVFITLFGIHQIIMGNYPMALFQFAIASFQIWGYRVVKKIAKWRSKKIKPTPPSKPPKDPSLMWTYLSAQHDKICPPIAFVDENDTLIRR